jgi:hypothetical protein
MNSFLGLTIRILFIACALVAVMGSTDMNPAIADDHHRGRSSGKVDSMFKQFSPGRHDEGNEATGQAAAWLFGIANVGIATSLLAKGVVRYAPMADQTRDRIKRMNQKQKRYLMPLHYFLNPVALSLALTHFIMSSCRSTVLPEWGLVLMASFIGVGIMVKFKMCPMALRRGIYRIHTSPLPLAALLTILFIGHSIVD